MRDAIAMRRRQPPSELGLEPRRVAIAETGKIGECRCRWTRSSTASAAPRRRSRRRRRRVLATAIMTTDALAQALHGALRRRHPLRPGEGRRDDPARASRRCSASSRPTPSSRTRRRRCAPAVDGSFERITVDGQMSTNDTVLLQASGESGRRCPRGCSTRSCCSSRSRSSPTARARPGSAALGSREAADADEAERAARAIANSPLVKTALFGRDPNWGRIAQAAGMALVGEELRELGARPHRRRRVRRRSPPRSSSPCGWAAATHGAHVWFSDLGYEYVRINAEYTT